MCVYKQINIFTCCLIYKRKEGPGVGHPPDPPKPSPPDPPFQTLPSRPSPPSRPSMLDCLCLLPQTHSWPIRGGTKLLVFP